MKADKKAFMALAALEPKLLALAADIEAARRASRGKTRVCANTLWYGNAFNDGFKDRLCSLVGRVRGLRPKPASRGERIDPEQHCRSLADILRDPDRLPKGPPALTTCEAYDVAYDYLYSLLPDCRNCGCPGIEREAQV